MTRYADRELTVIAVKTSMFTVQDVEGNTLTRDASKFKRKMFAGLVDSHVDEGLDSTPHEDENDTEPVVEALPDRCSINFTLLILHASHTLSTASTI